MKLPLIGPSYTQNSVNVDCERSVNLFPEFNELGHGKDGEVACLRERPGLKLYRTVGSGPSRSGYSSTNGRAFTVSGSEVYEGQPAGAAPVKRGDLTTASGPVSMVDNGKQLMVVDGSAGYIFTFADNSWVKITDDAYPTSANIVIFLAGFFIVNQPGTQYFWISELYDGLSWNGLDFGAAEGSPDNIISMAADHNEAVFLGTQSCEFWYVSGDASFPLTRVQGSFIEHGIAAPASLQKFDNTVVWLGLDKDGSGVVWRANGYQAVRCSTHAVETAIQKYGDISKATSYVYQMDGHTFYALNFQGANTTWVYDAATNLWHEQTFTNAKGKQERHRADWHMFSGSTHYVGDYQSGNIYELTNDALTDNGSPITRERTTTHTSADGRYLYYGSLELMLETGVVGQGIDPQVMLSWSDDGGHTWSDERTESIGKVGQYKKAVKFNRLGRSRDRVWRVRITDAVRTTLISATVAAKAGK